MHWKVTDTTFPHQWNSENPPLWLHLTFPAALQIFWLWNASLDVFKVNFTSYCFGDSPPWTCWLLSSDQTTLGVISNQQLLYCFIWWWLLGNGVTYMNHHLTIIASHLKLLKSRKTFGLSSSQNNPLSLINFLLAEQCLLPGDVIV